MSNGFLFMHVLTLQCSKQFLRVVSSVKGFCVFMAISESLKQFLGLVPPMRVFRMLLWLLTLQRSKQFLRLCSLFFLIICLFRVFRPTVERLKQFLRLIPLISVFQIFYCVFTFSCALRTVRRSSSINQSMRRLVRK